MRPGRRTLLALGIAGALAACTEDTTAPGKCPGFCPGGQLSVVDTVLNIISRDSSFLGYVVPESASVMLAVNTAGLDSRAIFALGPVADRVTVSSSDTTTVGSQSVDSAILSLNVTHRDTLAANLRISLYRLPLSIGPTTTFSDLAGPFTDSLLRTINVDSVAALPGGVDSATGDSVIFTDLADSSRVPVRVVIHLDSAQANYLEADSGRSAFGIRVSADSLASIAIGTVAGGAGPVFTWWGSFDSSGTTVTRPFGTAINEFNSFVSNAGAPTLDSNLVVGGVPAARSILRFALPRAIRDSAQVVRATLTLIPVAPLTGATSDSMLLLIYRIGSDYGAKSPCASVSGAGVCPFPPDSAYVVEGTVPIGSTDTVATEVTALVRAWQVDTLAPQAVMIRQLPEAGTLSFLRLYSTRSPAFRPALHITYVPRYSFGSP